MLVGPPLEYTPVYRDCSNTNIQRIFAGIRREISHETHSMQYTDGWYILLLQTRLHHRLPPMSKGKGQKLHKAELGFKHDGFKSYQPCKKQGYAGSCREAVSWLEPNFAKENSAVYTKDLNQMHKLHRR